MTLHDKLIRCLKIVDTRAEKLARPKLRSRRD